MFVTFAGMNPTEVIQQLKSMQLPQSIKLSEWENVVDVRLCISFNISLMVKAGPRAEQTPAWERLQRLYMALTQAG